MARFQVWDTIDDGASARVAWNTIRSAVNAGRGTVELVERTIDGKRVIEIRKWSGVRGKGDKSNAVGAVEGKEY